MKIHSHSILPSFLHPIPATHHHPSPRNGLLQSFAGTLKRQPSRKQHVQHHSCAPDVARFGINQPGHHLRGDVVRASDSTCNENEKRNGTRKLQSVLKAVNKLFFCYRFCLYPKRIKSTERNHQMYRMKRITHKNGQMETFRNRNPPCGSFSD